MIRRVIKVYIRQSLANSRKWKLLDWKYSLRIAHSIEKDPSIKLWRLNFQGTWRGSRRKSKRRPCQRRHGAKERLARLRGLKTTEVRTDHKVRLLWVNAYLPDLVFFSHFKTFLLENFHLSLCSFDCYYSMFFSKFCKNLSPYFPFLYAFKRKLN